MPKNPGFERSPDYYAARAAEERRNAMASADQRVREIHLELARRYDELAKGDGEQVPQPIDDDQQRTG